MRYIMSRQSKYWLAILNIFPIVVCVVRRSNSFETPSFDGSFDGAHFPPSSPFGAAFKEYPNLPKFPGGTDNMIDFPGTYSGQFAGPFPVPFQIPFPKPFPAALTSPRIYPSQFFNSFSAFNPYFQNNYPFHPFSGNLPFQGAFPFSSSLPYPGSYPFGGPFPHTGSYPFAAGQPFPLHSFPFPSPPLLPPPPKPINPTSSSVVLPESTAAALAAAKLIYGIVTRYSSQVLPYPITNPIPLAVPEAVRVPVAVNRPVSVTDIRPLHYGEIGQSNDKYIPSLEGVKPLNYESILHSEESLPPSADIKSLSFDNEPKDIQDIKPLSYEEIIYPNEVKEILDASDTEQKSDVHENRLSDVK